MVLCGAGLPPLLTKSLLGGGFVWAFEDNDGDSDRGFKAGTLDVTMLARWCYDKSAAGQGLCPLAGATTSQWRFGQQCSLAATAMSWWRVEQRCSPAGTTMGWWRVTQWCSPPGATMSWWGGGWRCLLAGAMKSRRQDGRRCLPTGATKSWRWGGRWYSLACVRMVLTAGRTADDGASALSAIPCSLVRRQVGDGANGGARSLVRRGVSGGVDSSARLPAR